MISIAQKPLNNIVTQKAVQ